MLEVPGREVGADVDTVLPDDLAVDFFLAPPLEFLPVDFLPAGFLLADFLVAGFLAPDFLAPLAFFGPPAFLPAASFSAAPEPGNARETALLAAEATAVRVISRFLFTVSN